MVSREKRRDEVDASPRVSARGRRLTYSSTESAATLDAARRRRTATTDGICWMHFAALCDEGRQAGAGAGLNQLKK